MACLQLVCTYTLNSVLNFENVGSVLLYRIIHTQICIGISDKHAEVLNVYAGLYVAIYYLHANIFYRLNSHEMKPLYTNTCYRLSDLSVTQYYLTIVLELIVVANK